MAVAALVVVAALVAEDGEVPLAEAGGGRPGAVAIAELPDDYLPTLTIRPIPNPCMLAGPDRLRRARRRRRRRGNYQKTGMCSIN